MEIVSALPKARQQAIYVMQLTVAAYKANRIPDVVYLVDTIPQKFNSLKDNLRPLESLLNSSPNKLVTKSVKGQIQIVLIHSII